MALIETDKQGNYTGRKNSPMLQVLSRPYPRAIHGNPAKLRSDSGNGTMYLEAETRTEGITSLWINNLFGTPKFVLNNGILQQLKPMNGGYIAEFKVHDTYSIELRY
jgi:hypothetical protein